MEPSTISLSAFNGAQTLTQSLLRVTRAPCDCDAGTASHSTSRERLEYVYQQRVWARGEDAEVKLLSSQ